MQNKYNPAESSNPGQTLLEKLGELQISIHEFSLMTGISEEKLDSIFKGGEYSIEEANLFEKHLSIPSHFWMRRQKQYQIFQEETIFPMTQTDRKLAMDYLCATNQLNRKTIFHGIHIMNTLSEYFHNLVMEFQLERMNTGLVEQFLLLKKRNPGQKINLRVNEVAWSDNLHYDFLIGDKIYVTGKFKWNSTK
jgi:plasmid maintenance system antidote protein VapI